MSTWEAKLSLEAVFARPEPERKEVVKFPGGLVVKAVTAVCFIYCMGTCQLIRRSRGAWVAQSVKHLPSAQVMILGSWDQVPHQAPCSAGSLLLSLPLPLLLPLLCSLSLSLSLFLSRCQINKIFNKNYLFILESREWGQRERILKDSPCWVGSPT